MEDRIKELREKKEKIKQGGGAEAVERLIHQKGMLTARERIDEFLDAGTFVEFDLLVTHHCTHFGMDRKEIPAEGVVTGYGKVDGRQVFVYAQDFTALGGSFGEMHGKKIIKVMDLAARVGAPVVQICHSGGLRLHETLGPMELFGWLFYRNSIYSGVIPQISLIMGSVAGGQAYSPGLTDFIFMTENSSLYIAGPAFVKAQTGEETTEEELGGAMMHATESGVCDLVAADDRDCLQQARELLSYLPSNNRELPPVVPVNDDPEREEPDLERIVPANSKVAFDMHEVIRLIVDEGRFFEVKSNYVVNMITCFARMNGRTVGIVANQPMYMGGVINVPAAEKAARFVRFCDAFNIPVISLQDSPAFMIGPEEERRGMIMRGAKLLYSFANATVPKITVIIRKAFAGATIAQGSKYIGADQVFAWPIAEICSVAPDTAGSVIFKKEIQQAEDPKKKEKELFSAYYEKFVKPYHAASLQQIDDIIEPRATRRTIINALEMLANKKEERPWRKRGIYPL